MTGSGFRPHHLLVVALALAALAAGVGLMLHGGERGSSLYAPEPRQPIRELAEPDTHSTTADALGDFIDLKLREAAHA